MLATLELSNLLYPSYFDSGVTVNIDHVMLQRRNLVQLKSYFRSHLPRTKKKISAKLEKKARQRSSTQGLFYKNSDWQFHRKRKVDSENKKRIFYPKNLTTLDVLLHIS